MLFVHHQYAVVLSFLKYSLLVVVEQEKLVLKNRSQQVNQKKTPVLLGVLEVHFFMQAFLAAFMLINYI
tara:strand:- start:664 stop:870 length:207 start_codon:yes stop_codon:yes gene_type:complete